MNDLEARRAAERAARDSYGRLVAMLAARTRDIAAAEDALSEAFLAALRVWPVRGVPDQPEAWLFTAARRTASNVWRHQQVRDGAADEIARQQAATPEPATFPDERLKLLFVCTHPAIDAAARTPLMLQTVLGLDAARIARAYLVPAATMSQRLVRAKARIRDAGVPFDTPEPAQWPERVGEVRHAIYAAYNAGWDGIAGAADGPLDLGDEALYLGRLLVTLLPDDAEAQGLLALMLYCESRRAARVDASGAFVPLQRQDVRRWSRDHIIEAEDLLVRASRRREFGRFQCEAAIQSVHAQRPITGHAHHAVLDTLYRLLTAHVPTVGVRVAHAAARLDAGEPAQALAMLDALPGTLAAAYQPCWVTRAHVLAALGRGPEACAAADRALTLTSNPAVAAFLRETLAGWRGHG